MIKNIKNGDLIITPNNIKIQILKQLSTQNRILNIKFMTLTEFKNNYFGTYKPESLYFLMNKYKLNYGVASEYLNNIFINTKAIRPYYQDLINNKLIEHNNFFKNNINSIKVIGYNLIDPYLKKEFAKYNVTYIENNKSYMPAVYGFDKQTDEISYVASDIVQKLKEVDINRIYLINVPSDYKDEIKRIFNLYHIPINLNSSKAIYSTQTTNIFLNKLKETKNISESLKRTPKNDICDKIIDTLNSLNISKIDDIALEIIENKLKETKIKNNVLKTAVNITDLNSLDENNYYYLLGFNQGIIPTIYRDDELIKDKEREKIGLLTSLQKYKKNKESTIKTILNTKNLIITYKLKDNYNTYYPSPLINQLNIKPIINPQININCSHDYNKNLLAIYLDNYLKWGEVNPNLKTLLNTYDIPYKEYDNKFSGINTNTLYPHLNNKLNISYSSMNNYFNCAFKFYIKNILKQDPFEESFATTIGNLFHHCLSKMYDNTFDLQTTYDAYLKNKTFTNKELFFLKKLYNDLEFVISTIKAQETHSTYNKVLTEKYIELDKSNKLNIKFVGIIDKIKYLEEKNKTSLAIIDYKTGTITSNLDNINYGLNLQLPVYIYLVKSEFNKHSQITGFYLQKILNQKKLDSNLNDWENQLKLDGYTINNENIIEKFDSTYKSSEVIKSMSVTNKGFSAYAKVLTEENIETINSIVDQKITEIIKNVEAGNFKINPKRIDNKLNSCSQCKFQDLCFKREEDIVDIVNTKFQDILNNNIKY